MELVQETRDGVLVCTVLDAGEPAGWVVIDSAVRGRSSGGLRMAPDVDEAEVRTLAHTLTLKFGFLGLPQGGAKAGVRWDSESPGPRRRERLVEFARAALPLLRAGRFFPYADMGTTGGDIRHMLEAVGIHVSRRLLREDASGGYTAVTVRTACRSAAAYAGLDFSRCSAAVEGFGSVGSMLARLLAKAGVRVVAVSTLRGALYDPRGLDIERLARLAREAGSRVVEIYDGAERIEREALLELPVELLCPCARHGSINTGNASRIAARVVCPGANSPVTPDAERVLAQRRVVVVPDFVASCGGVLGGTMEFAGLRPARIVAFMEARLGPVVLSLLEEAGRSGRTPREVAETEALRRFRAVQARADKPSLGRRLFQVGVSLCRRGLVPPLVASALAPIYFRGLSVFRDRDLSTPPRPPV